MEVGASEMNRRIKECSSPEIFEFGKTLDKQGKGPAQHEACDVECGS